MKRYLFLTIMFLCSISVLSLQAQENERRGGRTDEQRRANFEKFKAEREAFIAKEMGLTNEEATAFWPLCNELQEKKFELNRNTRRELRSIYEAIRKGEQVPDEDYDKIINLNADMKIKEAELDKEYLKRFRKILSAEKVFKYQRSEQRFARKMFSTNNK